MQAMNKSTRKRWFAARVTHGAYIGGKERAEHYIWRTMLIRCRTNAPHYEHVSVCKRWHKYENFIADMGFRPSLKYTLDRFPDPNGDYRPSNCRWATYSQQMKNRRNTPHFISGGLIGTVGDWAAHLGMSTPLARYRWNHWGTFVKGWTWQCVPPKELKKMRSKNISLA